MSYDPELSFALFKNDKGGNPKRPDYRGEAQIGGVVYKLAGWIKEKKGSGEKYIGGRLEPKQPKPKPVEDPANDEGFTSSSRPSSPPLDDDEPF